MVVFDPIVCNFRKEMNQHKEDMKRKILQWTSLCLFVLSQPLQAQRGEWSLVWSEEFNTDGAYDPNVWEPERGFVRNHEAQWYQGENAYQKDGCLVIEGRKEQRENPLYRPEGRKDWRSERSHIDYTAASLTTRRSFSFLYGRLEVRAKIPTAGGAWPAIWLLGKGMSWPSCGEIDVMEYYRIGGVPHILANAAWGNDRPHSAEWNSKKIPFTHFTEHDPQWADKFHLWRMDWTPQSIRIYLDDELLNDIPLSQTVNGTQGQHLNPFRRPQYLLLNLALGGDNGGEIDPHAFPMRYEIDYVRVYQRLTPRDSIILSDPCILADSLTQTYYMTGTGGQLWTSRDLNRWAGPYLFRTATGRLGMLWTSWIDDIYTQGVAYSESGTLDGPWVQEEQPITPPNFGHGMLFRTLDGRWLMSVHSHKSVHGRYVRVPHLFEVDLSGDKLVVGRMVEGEWK